MKMAVAIAHHTHTGLDVILRMPLSEAREWGEIVSEMFGAEE